jgi:hypothetical protein
VRIQQRVTTNTHGPVASEMRRRLAAELVAASIGTGRWDTPLPVVTEGQAMTSRARGTTAAKGAPAADR